MSSDRELYGSDACYCPKCQRLADSTTQLNGVCPYCRHEPDYTDGFQDWPFGFQLDEREAEAERGLAELCSKASAIGSGKGAKA